MGATFGSSKLSCRRLGLDEELTLSLAGLTSAVSPPPRLEDLAQPTRALPTDAYNIRNIPSIGSPPVNPDASLDVSEDIGKSSLAVLRPDVTPKHGLDILQSINSAVAMASKLPTPPNELLSGAQHPALQNPQLMHMSAPLLSKLPTVVKQPAALEGLDSSDLGGAVDSHATGVSQVTTGDLPMSVNKASSAAASAPSPSNTQLSTSDQPAVLTPPAEVSQTQFLSASPAQSEQSLPPQAAMQSPPASAGPLPSNGVGILSQTSNSDVLPWLRDTVAAVVEVTTRQRRHDSSVKALSQALPLPSNPGHNFPDLIEAVKTSTGSCPITFINVLHAVPGRSTLADLPTSVPSTPGPPIGGDDYFATKVFDSAVQAVDYDNESFLATSARCALAAPSSLNISIVERYIPPCTSAEVTDLFSANGRSLLVDRLDELSPHNGCLTFIYPTLQGARTFASEYVGPALDPLLRTMISRYEMTTNFAESVGTMCAIDELWDFTQMQNGVTSLCHEMSSGNPNAMHRYRSTPSKFSMVHSQAAMISLDASIWSTWWLRQEKSRIKSAVMQYYRTCKKMPVAEWGQTDIPQSVLVQEILTGVERRALSVKPEEKIEVGVFVIKREG